MNSFLKGSLHAVASAAIMWLPMLHFSWLTITVGGVLSIAANWLFSATVPTTSGASARQPMVQ